MSHAIEQIHGNRRLRRILGLSLSGAALVGLIYFEGASARAEADELDEVAEAYEQAQVEADELDEDELDENELDEAELNVVPTAIAPSGPAPAEKVAHSTAPASDATLAAANDTVAVAIADLPAAQPTEPTITLVTVPDLDGLSLYKARKQLKALGLKLSVRDEYKEKLPREYWGGYRVRKQKIEPGAEVKPGTTVRVRARMKRSYSMGY